LKKLLWIPIALILSACVQGQLNPNKINNQQQTDPTKVPFVRLDDYGPAPELTNNVWLNTDKPLRLSDLRGKVVLLEMWTFG